ncbi:MAG: gamma carbonic anhydrase family protein [Prochlorothrix sp.]|nr:gamma carbonic anhydrase family protein [Prochlorothrix sp.]
MSEPLPPVLPLDRVTPWPLVTGGLETDRSLWTSAAFIAPDAAITGQVSLGAGASVWYQAVVRGDVERIEVGAYTNIQDGAVLHCDPGEPLILEDYVTIGHRAVIHSAHVEQGSLIGIGAIVLNGVRIGAGSIIGAGSVVTKSVPPRSLVMGVPGKVMRHVSEDQVAHLLEHAQRYRLLAQHHASHGSRSGA